MKYNKMFPFFYSKISLQILHDKAGGNYYFTTELNRKQLKL